MDKYEVLKQLGKGGMGTAYMVRRKAEPGSFLAIKQVACADDSAANRALREAKMLQAIEHANIVAYVDVFLNMDQGLLQVCTVMEFCENGNLTQLLHKTKQQGGIIEDKRAANWMYQLADVLCYLHSRKILHRDLKPDNIFLHLATPSNMALKVGDFGLSATIEAGKRTSRVGTPCYLAPEILMSEEYGEGVDIWGAGCIFWEILTLDFLPERQGMLAMLVQKERLTPRHMPEDISHDLRSVVCECLTLKSSERPSAMALSSALLGIQQGQGLDMGVLKGGADWGRVVGGFFNQLNLGGIFSGTAPESAPAQNSSQSLLSSVPSHSDEHRKGLTVSGATSGGRMSDASTRSRMNSAVSGASGKQQMPAQAPAPEKRGLKWHSDKSLVDVKDITSRDFDQDYVGLATAAGRKGAAGILKGVPEEEPSSSKTANSMNSMSSISSSTMAYYEQRDRAREEKRLREQEEARQAEEAAERQRLREEEAEKERLRKLEIAQQRAKSRGYSNYFSGEAKGGVTVQPSAGSLEQMRSRAQDAQAAQSQLMQRELAAQQAAEARQNSRKMGASDRYD
eukprot:Tamp_11131.p1 GENE.Tamp_11131~~Tamp_11131.p1  ORF type:complete len:568 (+),score=102.68 Tamp_11131:53-1756(+)